MTRKSPSGSSKRKTGMTILEKRALKRQKMTDEKVVDLVKRLREPTPPAPLPKGKGESEGAGKDI